MPFLSRSKQISWTHHAESKMAFYGLSKQRVLRVMHTPKRIEEGIAPKTVAMMQPTSVKTTVGRPVSIKMDTTQKKEIWSQEIWVMFQETPQERRIISAWRYPGMTKPRSELALAAMRKEYEEFLEGKN
jgi:hypothetical protein